MKVLVIVPRYSPNWGEFYQIPLGIGYIASALRSAGHEVFSLNLNHHKGDVDDLVRRKVKECEAEVCATGGLSPFLDILKKIFAATKKANPTILNIAGGGIVSGEPEMSLAVMDVDVGVVGEGELTTVALLECLEKNGDLSEVEGIVYVDSTGDTIETKARPQTRELADLDWPDYDLLELRENIRNQRPHDNYFFHSQPESNPRCVDMITSRSCPFSCTFCFHPIGKVYRERPLEDFFAELDMVVDRYKVNMVAIIDELFSLKRRRLIEFCERIKPYNLQWMVQLHVNSVDDETITAMKEAGCSYISYGIESMSQPVLYSMEKKSKVQRIHDALELTQKYRIGIQGNLLFGDKAETFDTANESMHWWSQNRKFQINLTPLIVFPGSPDYYDALKEGMIEDRQSFVRDIPVEFNISRLNNKNMEMMRFFIHVFASSLLNLVKITSFRPSASQPEDRSTAYDISWTCAGCGHENLYERTIMPAGSGVSLRLTCRDCLQRWDMENQYHASRISKGTRTFAGQVQGAGLEIMRLSTLLMGKIKKKEFKDILRKGWTLLKLKRIGWLMNGNMELNNNPEKFKELSREEKLRWIGNRLVADPFRADNHNDFADALMDLGAAGAARLHYTQVVDYLDPANKRAREGINYVDGTNVSATQRHVYFVSWSNEAAPERRSEKTAEVRAKQKIEPKDSVAA